MPIKVKKGGAYVDPVGIFVKKGGVYAAAVGVSTKVGGGYVSVGLPGVTSVFRKLVDGTSGFRLLMRTAGGSPERVIKNLDPANAFQIAFADKNNNDRNIPGAGWSTVAPNEEWVDTTGFQAYVRLPSSTASVLIEVATSQQVS